MCGETDYTFDALKIHSNTLLKGTDWMKMCINGLFLKTFPEKVEEPIYME